MAELYLEGGLVCALILAIGALWEAYFAACDRLDRPRPTPYLHGMRGVR